MEEIPISLTEENFEASVQIIVNRCLYYCFHSDFVNGNKQCSDFIVAGKIIYHNRPWGEENPLYTHLYLTLILVKGLEEFLRMQQLLQTPGWLQDHKKIEQVWSQFWDTKKKFDYFNDNCCYSPNPLDKLTENLDKVESYLFDKLGRGLYMSPDILVKKSQCNICQLDLRACEHISGWFYNGVPCQEVALDIEIVSVSVVQSPYDMKCRIWPWNKVFENKYSVRIVNAENIDDFIRKK
ncbi:MAG: hypothetical protein V4543_07755 [Bacteroidota bacterium]